MHLVYPPSLNFLIESIEHINFFEIVCLPKVCEKLVLLYVCNCMYLYTVLCLLPFHKYTILYYHFVLSHHYYVIFVLCSIYGINVITLPKWPEACVTFNSSVVFSTLNNYVVLSQSLLKHKTLKDNRYFLISWKILY